MLGTFLANLYKLNPSIFQGLSGASAAIQPTPLIGFRSQCSKMNRLDRPREGLNVTSECMELLPPISVVGGSFSKESPELMLAYRCQSA